MALTSTGGPTVSTSSRVKLTISNTAEQSGKRASEPLPDRSALARPKSMEKNPHCRSRLERNCPPLSKNPAGPPTGDTPGGARLMRRFIAAGLIGLTLGSDATRIAAPAAPTFKPPRAAARTLKGRRKALLASTRRGRGAGGAGSRLLTLTNLTPPSLSTALTLQRKIRSNGFDHTLHPSDDAPCGSLAKAAVGCRSGLYSIH